MTTFHIYFDGSCKPNPNGIASYGIYIPELNLKISKLIGKGRGMTNNLAEWTGAVNSLKIIEKEAYPRDKIRLIGDSQLVIRQLSGKYNVYARNLIPLYREAIQIITTLKANNVYISFEHVSRDKNRIADELSQMAAK